MKFWRTFDWALGAVFGVSFPASKPFLNSGKSEQMGAKDSPDPFWPTLVETNQQREPFIIFGFFPKHTGPSSSKPCHGTRYRWTTSKTTLCPLHALHVTHHGFRGHMMMLHYSTCGGEFCSIDVLLRTAVRDFEKH
jgi:hypothetical protein